jgi:hypothetical protein
MKRNLLFLFVIFQFSACSQNEISNFQKVTLTDKKQGWDPEAGVIPSGGISEDEIIILKYNRLLKLKIE